MCRTERVTMTQKLDAMTKEVSQPAMITPADLYHAAAVDGVAMEVQARDVLEYWKSMPYLFNFLKNYEFRTRMDKALESPSDALRKLVKSAKPQLLTKAKLSATSHWMPPTHVCGCCLKTRWIKACGSFYGCLLRCLI
jgi:hypothetical protein